MNINPMMMLPLLLNKNGNGENNDDMTKMLSVISAMKNGDGTDAVMNLLPVDEKTRAMINMFKDINAPPSENVATNCEKKEFRPSFAGENINAALNRLINKSGK